VSCGMKVRPCSVTIREPLQVEKAVSSLVHLSPLGSLVSGVSVHITGDAFSFSWM
jgi:hypothetical protein